LCGSLSKIAYESYCWDISYLPQVWYRVAGTITAAVVG